MSEAPANSQSLQGLRKYFKQYFFKQLKLLPICVKLASLYKLLNLSELLNKVFPKYLNYQYRRFFVKGAYTIIAHNSIPTMLASLHKIPYFVFPY
jgi:hypothetical protein